MSAPCRKAVIAEDGKSVSFYYKGREVIVGADGEGWRVHLKMGGVGHGPTIDEALEDALEHTPAEALS